MDGIGVFSVGLGAGALTGLAMGPATGGSGSRPPFGVALMPALLGGAAMLLIPDLRGRPDVSHYSLGLLVALLVQRAWARCADTFGPSHPRWVAAALVAAALAFAGLAMQGVAMGLLPRL